jgi:hypothetical protein
MVDLDKLMTVSQCAKKTPLSEPQIRARINSGRLKSVNLAGGIFVHEDALRAFLAQNQF